MNEIDPVQMSRIHRKLAVDLFNAVWSLLENTSRTVEDNDTMIHAAHASRYHWEQVGESVNLARGEWQVSRVYSVLARAEPALYHARRCLDICLENEIGDFDLAYAYEALARAYSVAGEAAERQRYLVLALQASHEIAEEDDRDYVLNDLKTIPGFDQVT
jgi:hypothetical protein